MKKDYLFVSLSKNHWNESISDSLIGNNELKLKPGNTDGTYISPYLSSDIKDCFWHRLVIDCKIPQESNITVSFFFTNVIENNIDWSGDNIIKIDISDSRDYLLNLVNKKKELNELLQDLNIDENRKDLITSLLSDPEKMLKGKYLVIKLDLKRNNSSVSGPEISYLKVFYQKMSYLRYLPDLFQHNSSSKDFLERYLSIFESFLFDQEEKISGIQSYFDPNSTEAHFMKWLGSWLSLELYELLGEKNKEFILKAAEFYEKKGTITGIIDIVEFITGKKCRIKEYNNNTFRTYGMEHDRDDYVEINTQNKLPGYYRKVSKTVDTNDKKILTDIDTFYDELHYVTDTSNFGRYSNNVIGIFIFIPLDDSEFKIIEKDLLVIINAFLPVFIRAEINIVYEEAVITYGLSTIEEKNEIIINAENKESFNNISGEFFDDVKWEWFRTSGGQFICRTNDIKFRTPHSKREVWLEL